jgi:hypothetical protein
MRWFFLAFLLLVCGLGNLIGLDGFSPGRVPGMAFFNAFVLALFWIWWHAYFAEGFQKQKGMDQGLLSVVVLGGVFLLHMGVDALWSNDCSGFKSDRGRYWLLNWTVDVISQLKLCRPFGGAAVLAAALLIFRTSRRLISG